MNKADLIAAMAAESGLSKVDSKKRWMPFWALPQKLLKLETGLP